MIRDYAHSPSRTPKEPTHEPEGLLVHGTLELYDTDSYFALPVISTANDDQIAMTALNDTSTAFRYEDDIKCSTQAVKVDALDLWTALQSAVKDEG